MHEIVIVPLRPEPVTKDVLYLMEEKNMYNSGVTHLQFPRGEKAPEEMLDKAAERIFLQGTGYDPSWVKFLYTFFREPSKSNDKVSVFMGLTLHRSDSDHATVELDGDTILKKIRENDIVDAVSLAAFSAIMMQSEAAKQYVIQEVEK